MHRHNNHLQSTYTIIEPVFEDPFIDLRAKLQDLNVEAGSLLIQDIQSSHILSHKNSSAIIPIASLTKLMTALVIAENINPADTIIIAPEDILDAKIILFPGEKWNVQSLSDLMLIQSSNSAALILSKHFKERTGASLLHTMNQKAEELELVTTEYSNVSGLDINDTQPGSYSSAQDVSKLTAYIFEKYPNILEMTAQQNVEIHFNGYSRMAYNSNPIVGSIPDIRASKTGYTKLAGGNLVIIVEPENIDPVIITILDSTKEGRFTDVEKIMKALE